MWSESIDVIIVVIASRKGKKAMREGREKEGINSIDLMRTHTSPFFFSFLLSPFYFSPSFFFLSFTFSFCTSVSFFPLRPSHDSQVVNSSFFFGCFPHSFFSNIFLCQSLPLLLFFVIASTLPHPLCIILSFCHFINALHISCLSSIIFNSK